MLALYVGLIRDADDDRMVLMAYRCRVIEKENKVTWRYMATMSSLTGLFQRFCEEMMKRLKTELGRFYTGGYMSRYLPQTWVFKTENEVLTVVMDNEGNVILSGTDSKTPDVTIHTTEITLTNALQSNAKPKWQWQVAFNTKKGEAAYTYMRGKFGLWA